MAASALAVPELALDPVEAKSLAEATAQVAAYYPVSIDHKTLAWANLIMVAGAIYGTRAIAIHTRKKRDREKGQHISGQVPKDNIIRPNQFDPMQFQAGKMPPA